MYMEIDLKHSQNRDCFRFYFCYGFFWKWRSM